MSHYRRANTGGGSYFFTVVSYRRQSILCNPDIRDALRAAIHITRSKHPFKIDAWVLLPYHLHCIWTLPPGDADFANRWGIIKRKVSIACRNAYRKSIWLNNSKQKHRESTIWQRRYWEHQIRDQYDYNLHMDYIHYNPVKHGLCNHAFQWPYSTFHRYTTEGTYPADWTLSPIDDGDVQFGE